MTYDRYNTLDTDGAGRYCGIIDASEMPPPPGLNDAYFLLYNCGTQPCDTIIRIAGTAKNGLTLSNRTNGQKCSLVSLPDPAIGYLEINSTYGTVELVNGATRSTQFEYHDDGFLRLESYER